MSDIALPPCHSEQSFDCYWDATQHLGSSGTSFLNFEGKTVFIEVPDGMHLDDVYVTPSAENTYADVPNFSWTFQQATSSPVTPELATTGYEVGIILPLIALSILAVGLTIVVFKHWRR